MRSGERNGGTEIGHNGDVTPKECRTQDVSSYQYPTL
jgi:hypothetical protein